MSAVAAAIVLAVGVGSEVVGKGEHGVVRGRVVGGRVFVPRRHGRGWREVAQHGIWSRVGDGSATATLMTHTVVQTRTHQTGVHRWRILRRRQVLRRELERTMIIIIFSTSP